MGIFKWIMSLFIRKKNKAREHAPSKHVIPIIENKIDNKEKVRTVEQSPCEPKVSVIEKKDTENVLSPVNEQDNRRPRRRRRQQIPTELIRADSQMLWKIKSHIDTARKNIEPVQITIPTQKQEQEI